jgi:hypothetical protein
MLEPKPTLTEIAKSPKNGEAIEANKYRPFYQRPPAVVGLLGFMVIDAVLSFLIGGISAGSINFFITSVLSFLVVYLIAVQAEIYTQQWKAMQEGLKQQREFFELVERPIVNVSAQLQGMKSAPALVIHNNGRGAAQNIHIWFNMKKLNLPHEFRDKYPGDDFDARCYRRFLAANGQEVLPYEGRDFVLPDGPFEAAWHPRIIYGHGFYFGMDNKHYDIGLFAFRVKSIDGDWRIIRDDSLAYQWGEQEKNKGEAAE